MRPIDLEAPGAPVGAVPPLDEVVISKSPEFDEGVSGGKLYISAGDLIAIVYLRGQEWTIALPLEQILDAIGQYNRRHES